MPSIPVERGFAPVDESVNDNDFNQSIILIRGTKRALKGNENVREKAP
jgi:hypothetical protein